ncbi:protein of unknown function [Flavobacteriaceae bacterium MAR_2010_188]|nr:protein of unknown function [Flavobacteriaceae bacterium MAR_2010_188]
MKQVILSVFVALSIFGCSENESKENFTLQGNINGLKKGTVYLQHIQDSTFVSLDSVVLNGSSEFVMTHELKEPEILFLRLNKNDNDESMLSFFADKGVTTINSTLKNFLFDAEINGSTQQKLIEEYSKIQSRFSDMNLDLIKKSLETSKDSISAVKLQNEFNSLLKRKYLYTINFAFNHTDSEVAPYLAVSEIPDANKKYLDTIYNGLTSPIKASKYGKLLKELIDKR